MKQDFCNSVFTQPWWKNWLFFIDPEIWKKRMQDNSEYNWGKGLLLTWSNLLKILVCGCELTYPIKDNNDQSRFMIVNVIINQRREMSLLKIKTYTVRFYYCRNKLNSTIKWGQGKGWKAQRIIQNLFFDAVKSAK